MYLPRRFPSGSLSARAWVLAGLIFHSFSMPASAAEETPIEALKIPLTETAPQINGMLDETEWKDALIVDRFSVAEEGKPPEFTDAIRARVMRDKAWLYIAVEIRHPLPHSIVPKFTEPDSPVQRENSIEIALLPGASDGQWYDFGLSAGNVQSQKKVDKNRSVPFMSRPWRSATRITDQGWMAELALPLKSLIPANADPAAARLNIIATTIIPIYDSNQIEVGQRRLLASLNVLPNTNWMADDSLFPKAEGLQGDMQRVFLPSLRRVQISGYESDGGAFRYNVTANVAAFAGEPGEATIEVIDRTDSTPAGQAGTMFRKSAALKANDQRQITIPVPVTSLEPRTVTIRLLTGDDVWGQQKIANPKELNVFEAYLNRNYYTSEADAELCYRFGLSDSAALQGGRIEVAGKEGAVIASAPAAKQEGSLSIALKDIPAGTLPLEVRFVDANGATFAREPVSLVRRLPNPAGEWKIDRVNRLLLHNGKPMFPIGVYVQPGDLMKEEEAKDIGDAGFNCIVDYHAGQNVKTANEYLDRAQRHGLFASLRVEAFGHSIEGGGLVDAKKIQLPPALRDKYFPNGAPYARFHDIRKYCDRTFGSATEKSNAILDIYRQVLPALQAGVEAVKNHPALFAWDGFDEYNAAVSPTLMIASGRDMYRMVNEADGYHPVRVLAGGSPPPGPEYTDWTDIIAGDPYWSPVNYSSVFRVAKLTSEMAARGREEHKPAWITPVLMMWGSTYKRDFLPDEQRSQTYLALINGAGGLFYYVYPAQHELSWKTVSALANEVKAMEPALLAPEIAQSVVYDPATEPVKADVQILLRRDPRGGYLLLAANGQPYPVDAQIEIPGLDAGTVALLADPAATRTVAGGKFSEKFERYGTRAYRVTPPKPFGEPVVMRVKLTPHPQPPETGYTEIGRTDKKNIVPNPSFEEFSLPGWPHYWKVVNSSFQGPSRRIGGANPQFTLDENQPFHGKSSLRLDAGSRIYLYLRPGVKTPTDYVLSVYLRGNKPGVKVTFFGGGDAPRIPLDQTWTLTTEWKRYSVVVPIRPDIAAFPMLQVTVPNTPPDARVWIDALQLEPGREPTEFEP